ncbi:MAG: PDZ domain-containing protein [Planctomycetes bacterium]|nr:PDZ domain-containing protein [Planctomycetota bacterium]
MQIKTRFFVGLLLVVSLAAAGTALLAQGGADEEVAAILDKVEKAATPGERLEAARAIRGLKAENLPDVVKKALANRPALVRASALRELAALGEAGEAMRGLVEIAGDGTAPVEARIEACRIIGVSGVSQADALRKPLGDLAEQAVDVDVKMEAAKALWLACRDVRGKRELAVFLGSSKEEYRIKAALALGEMGEVAQARDVLKAVEKEPSDRGALAKALLRRDQAGERALLKDLPAARPDEGGAEEAIDASADILEKVLAEIAEKYVDEKKIERRPLERAGAEFLARALDATCAYVTPESKALAEKVAAKKGRLGITLALKGGALHVAQVTPGGPADRAGLRPLDTFTTIEKVDERKVFDLSVDEAADLLYGDPGTAVTFKVFRAGWKRARQITLTRVEDPKPDLRAAPLPGNVLYMRPDVIEFGVAGRMQAAIGEAKPEGLVLDLRSSRGDSVEALMEVAGLFLPPGKVVTWSKGRSRDLGARKDHATDKPAYTDIPLAVVVDQGTADMAELLAAAVEENGRGRSVGVTTFGRAVIHALLPLRSTGGKEALWLTVARYHTPRDHDVFNKGVEPGREQADVQRLDWMLDEMAKVRAGDLLAKHVESIGAEGRAAVDRLVAAPEGLSGAAWPGIDDLVAKADIKARKELARDIAAEEWRRQTRFDRGMLPDVETDAQLEAALLEVYVQIGLAGSDEGKRYAKRLAEVTNGEYEFVPRGRGN